MVVGGLSLWDGYTVELSRPLLLIYITIYLLGLSSKGKYKGKTIFPLLVFNFYCTKMALKARKSTEILRFRCFSLVGEAGLEPARPQWTLEPESSESGYAARTNCHKCSKKHQLAVVFTTLLYQILRQIAREICNNPLLFLCCWPKCWPKLIQKTMAAQQLFTSRLHLLLTYVRLWHIYAVTAYVLCTKK